MTAASSSGSRGCLRSVLALCVAIPTYLVAVPALLVLRALMFLIFDLPTLIAAKLCTGRGQRRRLMRSEDSFMMMETETNLCNIVTCVELDGPAMDLAALVSLVDRTLVSRRAASGAPDAGSDLITQPKWPRFQQRPVCVCGHWFWEDCEQGFDLASHFREQQGIVTEEDLAGLLAELQCSRMDPGKPLWDVVLAKPGLREGGSTVVIRVHHSMGDGIRLVSVLLEALDAGSAPVKRVGYKSDQGRLAELASIFLNAPLLAVEQLLTPRDVSTLKPRSLQGKKAAAFGPPVELERIKAVAREHRTTVSAVVVACLSQALARLHPGSGGTLKFWVPISLAPGQAEMRNDLIFMMMPIAVGAGSAADALSAASAMLNDMKSGVMAPALNLVIKATMVLLPFSMAHAFLNIIGDKASGVFSSVPGPSEQLSWGGAPVAGLRFLVPHRGGIAVGFSAVSYGGTMRIAANSDLAAMPEPKGLTEAWLAALQELEGTAK